MIMATWPADLVSLTPPFPPPGEDPIAQLQRSIEAFTVSMAALRAPLVRQIEAFAWPPSVVEHGALLQRQVATMVPHMRAFGEAMAAGTAAGDLWLMYRGAGDEDARLQAADRTLARFGGFVHKKAYARMKPELLAQAEAHRRSAQQELHARAQAALFETVHEVGSCTPGQMTEMLHLWRNRVRTAVLKDVLGDHWRRSTPSRLIEDAERGVWSAVERPREHATPRLRKGATPRPDERAEPTVWPSAHRRPPVRPDGLDSYVWLRAEFTRVSSRLTAQERLLYEAWMVHQDYGEAARASGLSYHAAVQAFSRIHTKLKSA
jgi:hypothetical protein